MSIFTVIQQNASGDKGTLDAAVRDSGLSHYPVQPDVWLVKFEGTAAGLCDRLEITPDGAMGTAVVTEVTSYYGRANPAVWSWLRQSWEGAPLG
jgi:hypothetical protein